MSIDRYMAPMARILHAKESARVQELLRKPIQEKSDTITGIVFFAIVLICLLVAAFGASGCTATPTQIAHVSTVSAGAMAGVLVRENETIYRRATDELQTSLQADGGRFVDYQSAVLPLTTEFQRRVRVLKLLSSHLYAAAGVIDASRRGAGPAEYGEAARLVVLALDETVSVLTDGTILPAVDVPPEINTTRAALRAMLNGGRDGGS